MVSNVSYFYENSGWSSLGYLKSSPDGNKIASANYFADTLGIYDFNKATGELTNQLIINSITSIYGIEFSPNSKLLYVSSQIQPEIYQFNLDAGSDSAIINSKLYIAPTFANGGALQLGPDGKIYHSRINKLHLGVINYPDSIGLSCNYNWNGLDLNGGLCLVGLPNYISFTPNFNFITNTNCNNTTSVFDINENKKLLKITNVLGQETSPKSNTPFFYLFDDGTVEKKIIIE